MILEVDFYIKFILLSVNFNFTLKNVFIHIFHPSIFYSFFCLKIPTTKMTFDVWLLYEKYCMLCGACSEVIRQILM